MGYAEHKFPDTLLLTERAELSLNCLTRALDDQNRFTPYCLMDLTGNPPKMIHSGFDYSDHTARVLDAIQLARHMTGSEVGKEREQQLKVNLENLFGEDGLHYTPDSQLSFHHANMHYQRSVLLYLVGAYLISQDWQVKGRIDKLCNTLRKIAAKERGFWYFPAVEYFPSGWRDGDWSTLGWGADSAHTNGRLIDPLVRYYHSSGSEVALELADQFSRHVVDHSAAFLRDGSFNLGFECREGHFHSRAVTMTGVLSYALITSNFRLLEWGKRVFDFARSQGTEFGWFPERLVEEKGHGCETCAVTDMIQSAIILGTAGYSSYWNYAEHYVRNQLIENQLVDTGWMKPDGGLKDSDQVGYKDVGERCLGGFAGWAQPNDLVSKAMHNWDLYMCCCAAGVRGLFLAWNNAIQEDSAGRIKVNLLFNRTSPWVKVRSHIPYKGRVEIEPRQQRDIFVRVPASVSKIRVRVRVADRPIEFSWLDDYVILSGLKPNEQAVIEFPLEVTSRVERVWSQDFIGEWKGDTLVAITPPGEVAPLYRREHYRNNSVGEKVFRVFDPGNAIAW